MNALRWPIPMTLLWLSRRCAWYFGWLPMLLSVSLLIMWLILHQQTIESTAALVTLEQDIRQLAHAPQRQIQSPPTMKAAALVKQETVAADEKTNLATMWQQLPDFSALSPRMMQIAHLAQQRHIALNVGDYQWQAHQNAGSSEHIQQFDMRFTVQADYATCRQFILDVLQQYPTMALTGLELRKNETVQPTLDATLTFSVFIRGGLAHGDGV